MRYRHNNDYFHNEYYFDILLFILKIIIINAA